MELTPNGVPRAEVDLNRRQVMKLVRQDNGTRPERSVSQGEQVISLAVNPGALAALGVCLDLGTMRDQLSHDATKLVLDLGQGRGGVFDKVVQQPGNHNIFIETGSLQNPGHGDYVRYIRNTTTAPDLILMSDRGHAQGMLEPVTEEGSIRAHAWITLEETAISERSPSRRARVISCPVFEKGAPLRWAESDGGETS